MIIRPSCMAVTRKLVPQIRLDDNEFLWHDGYLTWLPLGREIS